MQPFLTIAVDKTANVAAGSTIVLPANRDRSYALLVNDSDTIIYIMKAKTAALNRGIRLNAEGGSYEINATNPYKGEIAAIHGGAGNKVLLINEDEARYL